MQKMQKPIPRDIDLRVNRIKQGRITIHQTNKMVHNRKIQKYSKQRGNTKSNKSENQRVQALMPFKRMAQKIQELDPTNGANETN